MTTLSLAALVNQATGSGAVVHMHTAIAEQTSGDRQIRKLVSEHKLHGYQWIETTIIELPVTEVEKIIHDC